MRPRSRPWWQNASRRACTRPLPTSLLPAVAIAVATKLIAANAAVDEAQALHLGWLIEVAPVNQDASTLALTHSVAQPRHIPITEAFPLRDDQRGVGVARSLELVGAVSNRCVIADPDGGQRHLRRLGRLRVKCLHTRA